MSGTCGSASFLVPCAQPPNPPFPKCACDAKSATPFTFDKTITVTPYGMVAGKAANLFTFTFDIISVTGSGASKTTAAKAEFFLNQGMK